MEGKLKTSAQKILKDAKKLFFVGIGGVSMSSLALHAKSEGFSVLGSDKEDSRTIERLRESGIDVYIGHNANNIDGCDAVIYTSAIGDDNAELSAAKERGIPTMSRAEFMGAMMAESRVRIGISGSHGKSTVTAMTAHMLKCANKAPTIMCGADIPDCVGGYAKGDGAFLFEACEYKDSFLSFSPNIAAILNIDLDHVDYFSDIKQLKRSFSRFAHISYDDGGAVVVCADDSTAMEATSDIFAITFGIDNEADYKAENIVFENGCATFDVYRIEEPFIKLTLSVPGRHNIYNALATVAIGCLMGISADVIASSISEFKGVSRRFEKKCTVGGADVYIDYAHHPREIAAAIDTAKSICHGKVITLFEPHTYSRTRVLFDDFRASFGGADVKLFSDIYAAREALDESISSKMLADAVGGEYVASYEAAADRIRELANDGDIVLIVGAGKINTVSDLLGG